MSPSRYVHQNFYKNMVTDGFDPERLLPGICVQYKAQDKLREMLDWNVAFGREGWHTTMPGPYLSVT